MKNPTAFKNYKNYNKFYNQAEIILNRVLS